MTELQIQRAAQADFPMARGATIMIGTQDRPAAWSSTLPMTVIYLIGIALSGVLAFCAPHYHGLAFTMSAIFSLQIVPIGLIESFPSRKAK